MFALRLLEAQCIEIRRDGVAEGSVGAS
jgi:hypothetical protein